MLPEDVYTFDAVMEMVGELSGIPIIAFLLIFMGAIFIFATVAEALLGVFGPTPPSPVDRQVYTTKRWSKGGTHHIEHSSARWSSPFDPDDDIFYR